LSSGSKLTRARFPQAELTASTALHLWYGNMQTAIMEGQSLLECDTLGYNFLHYACLEGNMEVCPPASSPLCTHVTDVALLPSGDARSPSLC